MICPWDGCDEPMTGMATYCLACKRYAEDAGAEEVEASALSQKPSLSRGGDIDRSLAAFRALCPSSDSMIMTRIPGNPKSKKRARAGAHGVYRTTADKEAERHVESYLAVSFPGGPRKGYFAVGCIFFRGDRQRVDVDNLLKLVMDAATNIVWLDDAQVTAQLGVVEYDPDNPRTVVMIGEHETTMERPSDQAFCEQCGKEFQRNTMASRFCSRLCSGLSQRTMGESRCPTCRTVFRRRQKAQVYCSKSCARKATKGAGPKNDPPKCQECGGLLHL